MRFVVFIGLVLCVSDLAGAKKKPSGISCGAPHRGKVLRAKRLPPQGLGYLVPLHWRERNTNYGSSHLVRVIRYAAGRVARTHPGSVFVVGDLSARKGGKIRHHKSHQSGRDADIAFLRMDDRGKVLPPVSRFLEFTPSGKVEGRSEYFDLRRNWEFVRHLLTHGDVEIEFIFVSGQIRQWLLTYALVNREPKKLRRLAQKVIRVESGHNDHMHIRVSCSKPDVAHGRCSSSGKCGKK